jgi:hypothetical protein
LFVKGEVKGGLTLSSRIIEELLMVLTVDMRGAPLYDRLKTFDLSAISAAQHNSRVN